MSECEKFWRLKTEVCFTCGKEEFSLATPMRCAECVKNKIPVQTSPVRDAFWVLISGEKTFKECILCKNPFIYDGSSENCLWCEINKETE